MSPFSHDKPVPRRCLTVKQWVRIHPWPTEAGLRHLIFFAAQNGFEGVIRRAGRRILIDETAFFAWIDAQKPWTRFHRCTSSCKGSVDAG